MFELTATVTDSGGLSDSLDLIVELHEVEPIRLTSDALLPGFVENQPITSGTFLYQAAAVVDRDPSAILTYGFADNGNEGLQDLIYLSITLV